MQRWSRPAPRRAVGVDACPTGLGAGSIPRPSDPKPAQAKLRSSRETDFGLLTSGSSSTAGPAAHIPGGSSRQISFGPGPDLPSLRPPQLLLLYCLSLYFTWREPQQLTSAAWFLLSCDFVLQQNTAANLRLASHFGEVRSRQPNKKMPRLSARPAHGDSDVLGAASRGFPAAPHPSGAGRPSSGPTPTEDAVALASKVTGEASSSPPAAASLRIERRGREHLMGKSHRIKARVLTMAAPHSLMGTPPHVSRRFLESRRQDASVRMTAQAPSLQDLMSGAWPGDQEGMH